MKRRFLLIGACFFGALSVGLNIYLYVLKKEAPAASPAKAVVTEEISAESPPQREMRALPGQPGGKFDFSGTAFADDSWKLEEPRSTVRLDKPFDWEDVNPARPKGEPEKAPAERFAGSPSGVDAKPAQPPLPAPPK